MPSLARRARSIASTGFAYASIGGVEIDRICW